MFIPIYFIKYSYNIITVLDISVFAVMLLIRYVCIL